MTVRRATVERLATALDVDAAVLDGTVPFPEDLEGWASAETKIDGERLQHFRTAKRWSRRRLAEKSRVSERQIARLEAAEATVPVRATTLSRLKAALGVDARELSGNPSAANQSNVPPDDDSSKVGLSVLAQTAVTRVADVA